MDEHAYSERTFFGCAIAGAVTFLLLLCIGAIAGVVINRNLRRSEPPTGYAGDPELGRAAVTKYGCPACHEIPGFSPAGTVGPSLDHIASRAYIAGHFTNEPIQLQEWIQHPQKLKPDTGMPDLRITDRDTRDIAAFLGTLR